jgi:CheY-like chemotaxis protein
MADRKPVILCVDDEENSLVLRKLVLQKAGYEVLTATSGKAALELTATARVDLILSDQLMSGMTGIELVQKIKIQFPKLPVVLISGVNEIPTGSELADAFLSKVEGPDALCRSIAAILDNGSRIQPPPNSTPT